MTTLKRELRGVADLISIDRRASKPLYQQIYESFRSRVLRCELRAGELVPSSRSLARDLRISRLPVLNAYAQLLAEGYFESKVGAGTFIATSLPGRQNPARAAGPSSARRTERRISTHAAALPEYERPSWAESLGPFQVGQPELDKFPIDIWLKLTARYSRRMRLKGLQYGDPMGLQDLREGIAAYVRRSRGVRCEARQIMVVSGSQQALDLTTRVLLDAGTPAWVEEPGYWLVHNVLRAAGCRAVPVPVDEQGLNVAAGIQLSRNARAAFVAPSHQYPLGVTMSAARRLQLLEWAERAGAWIVEDDYDSEYRYDSMPVASLQGLDENDRVIYIGTFSKVMFPSLRLGYLIIPPDLVNRFAAVRQTMDLCPPHITQAIMVDFLREGHFARHIRRMRPTYAERRRVLIDELRRELGDSIRLMGADAGMHVAILLNARQDDGKIAAAAAQQSLWLSALSALYVGSAPRQGLVLGFGNTKSAQIPAAVRHLKMLVQRGARSTVFARQQSQLAHAKSL
ncbi:MAG: PLP-dependent aminotransferase family protein [Chthoniobacterales bacterium]|nr:PLP-dependent aminotransferase family protein [Chthoniobacterales bacterium]